MADLVEKYFQEDLSEAEQEALSGSLLSSEDSALRFERMSQEAYLRYGLPEPKPHWRNDPPASRPPLKGLGPWIGSVTVLLGIGAGVYFFAHSHRPSSMAPGKLSGAPLRPSASLPAGPGVHSVASSLLKKDISKTRISPFSENSTKNPKPLQGSVNTALSGSRVPTDSEIKPINPSNPGLVSPATTAANPIHTQKSPINLDQNPSQSYSGISVQVRLAHPSDLAVQVLDTQDNIRAVLYRGSLGMGNWVFQWDGQLSDGAPAQPGYYQIQVRSGLFVQTKKIQIQ